MIIIGMETTSLSLLARLQQEPDSENWNRLVDIYTPLVRVWLQKYDVQDSDADDLVQEVLLAVSKNLGEFEHGGRLGSFRAWIKAILVNRLRNFWRSRKRRPQAVGDSDIDARLAQLEDPMSKMSRLWDRDHDQYVLRQLLTVVEQQFSPTTWQAFRRVSLDGVAPRDVARDLGISINAVFIAKSRVLSKLRQESAGLVESSFFFSSDC